jgi:signal transduction histidine kinase
MGRLSLIMIGGVVATQLAASLVLAHLAQAKASADTESAARYLGHGAANTIRFFRSVPSNYRPLLIQQLREMGGTRFFINLGRQDVAIQALEHRQLADRAADAIHDTLAQDLPFLGGSHVAFAWPDQLAVAADGTRMTDLPESWVQHILLVKPEPAPVLVIQAEIEPGDWLYLAALMPNPYFLDSNNPFRFERLVLAGLPLAAVLLISMIVILRWVTRPLAGLSKAAEAFGNDGHMPELKEEGSREFVSTVRAFTAMRLRISKYLEDRERLFVSISHDLRTPITRLKLRAELLDDDQLRAEFEEDLDDLDVMVKGALQCVKDSDLHENATCVQLDRLFERLVRAAQLAGHDVRYAPTGLTVWAKPLALKRAVGNLVDNAIFYGERADIAVRQAADQILIEVRDHGPGVPDEALAHLTEPRVRLLHGQKSNAQGLGLGLTIANDIVQGMNGTLQLSNHPDGGLLACICLPATDPAQLGNVG